MSRILLSVHHRQRRSLLRTWLSRHHDVIAAIDDDAAAALVRTEPFNLGVVDHRTLRQLASSADRTAALSPPPFLLVCSRPALRELDRSLTPAVKDVILTPLAQPEVQRRVTALLTAHADSQPRPEPELRGWWNDENLAFVLECGGAGIWDWNTETGQLTVSRNLEAEYGLPRGGLGESYERFLETIHPDDRASVVKHVLRGASGGHTARVEFRSLWPDGSVHWIGMQSRGFCDHSGKVVRIAGLATNIDDRQKAQEDLRHNEERLRLAVEGANIGLWDWDVRSNEVYYSERWKRQLGFAKDEFPDRMEEWSRRLHPDDRERLLAAGAEFLHHPSPNHQIEFRLRHKDGTYRWISSHTSVLVDSGGRPYRMLGAHIDVTDRKRSEVATSVLLDVAREVSATSNRDELLARVQKRAAEALSCEAMVVVYQQSPGHFRVISHYGIPEPLAEAALAFELSPDRLLRGRFIAKGVPLVINDPRAAGAPTAEIAKLFGFRALAATPLYVRGRALGALVGFRVPRDLPFDAADADLISAIAQQLAIALESLDLHQAQAEEAQVAGVLAHLGQSLMGTLDPVTALQRACRGTVEALACDSSYALLRESDHVALVAGYGESADELEALRAVQLPVDLLQPFFERVRRDGVVQISPGNSGARGGALMKQYGIASSLNIPLKRDGEIVGLIVAATRRAEGRFTPLHERIAREIGELVSVTLEHARLVQEAQRGNTARTEFVATMSHELRTPLNIIIGYTQLLIDGALGPLNTEQCDTLSRVSRATDQLIELVNTVLDLSRLEGGRMPVDLSSVRLDTLMAEISDETRALQEKPEVRWVWPDPGGLPSLRTDRRKLKVVLKNLIGNAIKFTSRGTVSIAARGEENKVLIEVADTGIGIPPSVVPVIFDAFRQGDGSATRSYDGVGLGLYIVRRLLDEIGGTITVESEVDRGTTFCVVLPLDGP